jgi:hypothetical protein
VNENGAMWGMDFNVFIDVQGGGCTALPPSLSPSGFLNVF